MSAIDPADIVRRYHAAIDRLDFVAIEAFFAPDAHYVSNGVGALHGREAIMQAFRCYFEEHPDQRNTDELVETLSALSARSVWRLEATRGTTGLAVRRHGEEIVTVDEAGLILVVDVRDW